MKAFMIIELRQIFIYYFYTHIKITNRINTDVSMSFKLKMSWK